MSDTLTDASPLQWSPQQWAAIRAAVQESARKARVASSFLKVVGPLPADQETVPSQWIDEEEFTPEGGAKEAPQRLVVKEGRTIHLTSVSANIYLKGIDIRDPELAVAKSMARRAGDVLGRLEDSIIFNGLREGDDHRDRVKPPIHRISGGQNVTGLLEAPGTLANKLSNENKKNLREKRLALLQAAKLGDSAKILEAAGKFGTSVKPSQLSDDELLIVKVVSPTNSTADRFDIVDAVVKGIDKLEARGHFGPFNVVLGHELYQEAQRPSSGLVLPSDRIVPFLDGGQLLRSSTIPTSEGVIVAGGGDPVELVIGTDMDIKFLQTTIEPRYVLRVHQRFTLRIKQLDAVCVLTSGNVDLVLQRNRSSDAVPDNNGAAVSGKNPENSRSSAEGETDVAQNPAASKPGRGKRSS